MVWSSPVLFLEILIHIYVSPAILQHRDITLSTRYGQYQEWLTTVHFQKYLVDSISKLYQAFAFTEIVTIIIIIIIVIIIIQQDRLLLS